MIKNKPYEVSEFEKTQRKNALARNGHSIAENTLADQDNSATQDEKNKKNKHQRYARAMSVSHNSQIQVGILDMDFFEKTQKGLSTIDVTQEEIAMNEYFRDTTGTVPPPESLKQIAKKNGLSDAEIQNLDKNGFADQIYEFNPEAAIRITSRSDITKDPLAKTTEELRYRLERDGKPFEDKPASRFGSSDQHWQSTAEETQTVNPTNRLSASPAEITSKADAKLSFSGCSSPTPHAGPKPDNSFTLGGMQNRPSLALDRFAPKGPDQSMAG